MLVGEVGEFVVGVECCKVMGLIMSVLSPWWLSFSRSYIPQKSRLSCKPSWTSATKTSDITIIRQASGLNVNSSEPLAQCCQERKAGNLYTSNVTAPEVDGKAIENPTCMGKSNSFTMFEVAIRFDSEAGGRLGLASDSTHKAHIHETSLPPVS